MLTSSLNWDVVCYSVNCSVISDSATLWTVACQAPLSVEFSSQNTGVVCHSLFQGIFLTQGSNPGLLHCRWVLYFLSHQGSPYKAISILILHEVKMIYVILPETDFVIKQTLDLLVNWATNMLARVHAHTHTHTIALYWRVWDHTGIFHWNNIAEELLCFQKYQMVLCCA